MITVFEKKTNLSSFDREPLEVDDKSLILSDIASYKFTCDVGETIEFKSDKEFYFNDSYTLTIESLSNEDKANKKIYLCNFCERDKFNNYNLSFVNINDVDDSISLKNFKEDSKNLIEDCSNKNIKFTFTIQ